MWHVGMRGQYYIKNKKKKNHMTTVKAFHCAEILPTVVPLLCCLISIFKKRKEKKTNLNLRVIRSHTKSNQAKWDREALIDIYNHVTPGLRQSAYTYKYSTNKLITVYLSGTDSVLCFGSIQHQC